MTTSVTTDPRDSQNRFTAMPLAPAAIVFGALVMRFLLLGSESLWGDEAYSWFLARAELVEVWADGGNDLHHPPLYYTVLHLAMRMSDSEWMLRLPSAIASTATVGLVFLTANRLTRRSVALLASILSALSPLDIWYAQEARHAALGTMLFMLAVYGLVRRDRIGWVIATSGLFLGVFTYYIVLVAWFAVLGASLAFVHRRDYIRTWVLATAVTAVVFIPVQGTHFLAGFDDLLSNIGEPTLAKVMSVIGSPVGILLLAAAGMTITAFLVRWVARRSNALLGAMIPLGFLFVTALAPLARLYTVKRIALVIWAPILILVAYALASWLPRRLRKPIVGLALLASFVGGMVSIFGVHKDDWRGAIAAINGGADGADQTWAVVYPGPWGVAPYLYYGVETPLVYETDPERYPDLARSSDGDIWIVASRTPRDPVPSSGPEAWLDENWDHVGTIELHRLAVRRFSPP
jgi:hypothetical protein